MTPMNCLSFGLSVLVVSVNVFRSIGTATPATALEIAITFVFGHFVHVAFSPLGRYMGPDPPDLKQGVVIIIRLLIIRLEIIAIITTK